jgi:hypothetical protein
LPPLRHHATTNPGEAVGVGGQNPDWFQRPTAQRADLESALTTAPRSTILRTTVAAMAVAVLEGHAEQGGVGAHCVRDAQK